MAKEPQIRIVTEKELGKLLGDPKFLKFFERTLKGVAKVQKNKTRLLSLSKTKLSKKKRKT